jgi:hypothetical protein
MLLIYLIASRFVFHTRVYSQIYDSGFTIIYYSINICKGIRDILVVLNLYYYQFKVFHLFKLLMDYKMTKMRYILIILILFSIHFLIQGFYAFIYFTSFKMNINFLNALFSDIYNIFATLGMSGIYFITWGKKFVTIGNN